MSSDTDIQTVSTRVLTSRTRANSRNNLDDIPVATPLLGETHGQISNAKNLRTQIDLGDSTEVIDVIKAKMSDRGAEVAGAQTSLIREIGRIDQKLGKLDQTFDERAKQSVILSKEVAKFEVAEQVDIFINHNLYSYFKKISSKLSGSLRALAIRLNQINMALPVEKRLEKLVFD